MKVQQENIRVEKQQECIVLWAVPVLDKRIEEEKVLKRTVHGKGGNFATFYYGQMQFLRPVNPKIQFKDALLNESIRNPDRFAGCI